MYVLLNTLNASVQFIASNVPALVVSYNVYVLVVEQREDAQKETVTISNRKHAAASSLKTKTG